MSILDQILAANDLFVNNLSDDFINYYAETDKKPKRQIAVFTCMDTRLVDFLEPAMGIRHGEAKVIKNAGNTVTRSFGATIRSLLVGIFELDVKEIVVVGHYDCGIANISSQSLINKMLQRGISPDAIKMVEDELANWIDNFHYPENNITDVVLRIRNNPLIPKDVPIHGLIFNPHTGKLDLLVDGYKHCNIVL